MGRKELVNIQRSVSDGDARGREVLDVETRLVSLILKLVFLVRNLPDLITPHRLGLVCGPLSRLRTRRLFVFRSWTRGLVGNLWNEGDDQLRLARIIVPANETYVVTV